MIINDKDNLTFDGKRISFKDALKTWQAAAFGADEFNGILYTDIKSRCRLTITSTQNIGKALLVDFGRDTIPFINDKVTAIIAEYRKTAQREDAEKAAREAYKLTDEYKLSRLEDKIEDAELDIDYYQRYIEDAATLIIDYYRNIARQENNINECGIAMLDKKSELADLEQQANALRVKIEQNRINAAINAAAADMLDDGSNDDPDDTIIDAIDFTFTDSERLYSQRKKLNCGYEKRYLKQKSISD